MSRKPFYLFLITVLCIIALIVLCVGETIVPNDAIGQSNKLMDYHLELVGRNTLKLLKLYSAECYADSVKKQKDFGWEWIWIHREPTLSGFMAFLEGKYKVDDN